MSTAVLLTQNKLYFEIEYYIIGGKRMNTAIIMPDNFWFVVFIGLSNG